MRYKRFLYFISDASLITLFLILAFVLCFGFNIPPAYARDLFFLLPLVLATKIFVFKAFGFHNQLWRYASLKEGLRLVNGISASSLLILAVLFFFRRVGVPRAVIVIDWFLTLVLIGGCYFLARVRGELCSAVAARGQSLKKVVIVGAGDVGSSLARQMQKRPEKGYKPVAFLDDDPSKRGLMIHGIEVAGGSGAIPSVIAEHPADEVIIAIPSVGHRERMRIAIECEEIGIPYKVVPNLIELVNGKVKLSQIRKVDVKELLGREEVGINLKDAENCYRDKTVLITGAAGSIGSELCRQAMTLKPARVIAADISENGLYELEEKMAIRQDGDRAAFEVRLMNVKDELAVDRIISRYRPQIVFHAAAYKQVPMMERHALEVMENNFLGTRVMIDAARRYLVDRFVFISTDKAVNPRSIMGLSKQFGEKALKVAASGAPKTRFIAVRFGNVLVRQQRKRHSQVQAPDTQRGTGDRHPSGNCQILYDGTGGRIPRYASHGYGDGRGNLRSRYGGSGEGCGSRKKHNQNVRL